MNLVLHGVDLTGSDSDGAASVRVVERDLNTPRNPVVSRGQCDRRSLVRMIQESGKDGRAHLWRVDAAGGVPLATLGALDVSADWRAAAEWMHGCGSPRLWRSRVRQSTRQEPRRVCDASVSNSMAPMNLRVFKQTWGFTCQVLLPLADAGVHVEPMAPATGSTVSVCEGSSEGVLAMRGWQRRGYKGAGEPPRAVRSDIIRQLRHAGINVPPALATQAENDAEGEWIDALLLVTDPTHTVVPSAALIEGWSY